MYRKSNIPIAQVQAVSDFTSRSVNGRDLVWLFGVTAVAILVHGYHVGIEEMAVYLSAINWGVGPLYASAARLGALPVAFRSGISRLFRMPAITAKMLRRTGGALGRSQPGRRAADYARHRDGAFHR